MIDTHDLPKLGFTSDGVAKHFRLFDSYYSVAHNASAKAQETVQSTFVTASIYLFYTKSGGIDDRTVLHKISFKILD
ncbi:hypothetical protein XM53_11035 [Roseovarius atlanticus]|uniref:Uncharacterized protein n=1 Tax=Roseovarius atlanticus TaxID=1641875 RepID=A0A0T5NV05_9RHOB|nr:hypothetical protein XM53_11035 [Roseovarius atlanticus]